MDKEGASENQTGLRCEDGSCHTPAHNIHSSIPPAKNLRVSVELYVPNVPESIRPQIANRKNIHVISPIQAEMPQLG